MRIYIFLILLFSCTSEPSIKETLYCTLPPSAYSPDLYTLHKIYQDPVIDGKPIENCWSFTRWNTLSDSNKINLDYKLLWRNRTIFLLIRIPEKNIPDSYVKKNSEWYKGRFYLALYKENKMQSSLVYYPFEYDTEKQPITAKSFVENNLLWMEIKVT